MPDIRARITQLDELLIASTASPSELFELGGLKLSIGDWTGAIAAYRRCLLLAPDTAIAYNNLGFAQMKCGRHHDAITSFEAALRLNPQYHRPLVNLGKTLREAGRPGEAIERLRQALSVNPDYPPALVNLGDALCTVGDFEAAEAALRHAMEVAPGLAEAGMSLAEVLWQSDRAQEALLSLESTIAVKPDNAEAHFTYGQMLLRMGRYPEGWAEYEWRWNTALSRHRRHRSVPLWVGREPLTGRTVLLHAEQGYGDVLQFCRYAQLVSEQGARVILQVYPALLRLMGKLRGVDQVISLDDPTPTVDFQCPLMSLPLAFGTRLDTIPSGRGYLFSEPGRPEQWKLRLGQQQGLRVGLVWSGGFRPDQGQLWGINARRNIGLEMLADLRHPRIEYVSLQKGEPAQSEPQELRRRGWSGPNLIDFPHELTDFSETAALIENLDLVVSVDTSTAHLCAAMGKPTWILNRFDGCWRWLMDRTDSPWYPSVRLFRQRAPGNWKDVVQQVRDELFRLAA